jgi:hypothetical protein
LCAIKQQQLQQPGALVRLQAFAIPVAVTTEAAATVAAAGAMAALPTATQQLSADMVEIAPQQRSTD